ncbi:uncharacterized protein SCHCODRAFT_02572820 [Schizophyllum commune H4-8]|nr:uncharacterized protein SCHCODRAFT_02572820 [Schizophyllum commune H4-8]KAI5895342.1 hypothetical protein SCHCODRAFT_02572820 [Schizophyllum commune H4-8]
MTPDIPCSISILADLRAMERGRACIEAELDDLVVQLARVMERRSDVERQQAISTAMLSPVRRLPVEILSKIFELSIPHDWEQKFLGLRGPASAEVCKVWRTVAIGMPQLWNNIGIDYRTDSKHLRSAFDLRMARCGQGPLRLHLAFHRHWGRSHSVPEVWATLCSQSHRWSALTVENFSPRTAKGLHWTWPSHFPILSSLELVGEDPDSPSLHVFSDAPITSLKMCFSYSPRRPPALHSTWKITNVDLHCEDIRSFLPLLLDCYLTLQHLDVETLSEIDGIPAFFGMEFPVLETLKLHYHACRFLTYLETPRLRRLDLYGHEGGIGDMKKPLSEVAEKIRTSGVAESLGWLTLTDIEDATQNIIQCLDLLPVLQSLDIENRASPDYGEHEVISEELLRALVRVPTDAASMNRLPRLRRLGLLWRMSEGIVCDRIDLVEALLRSRSTEDTYEGKNLARIEWLETDLPGDWSLSDLSRHIATTFMHFGILEIRRCCSYSNPPLKSTGRLLSVGISRCTISRNTQQHNP